MEKQQKKIELKRKKKWDKGITLIALVVTIIVLLILAGISISMLTGQKGILNRAGEAKEESEIAEEKEQLKLAMMTTQFESETDLINRKEKFKKCLQDSTGSESFAVYINGNGYTVHFLSTNNIYTVKENRDIVKEKNNILEQDTTPGILSGSGTEEEPYIIMSIEDLVEWSKNYNSYKTNYIKLGRDLDFNSELSYCDYTTNVYNSEFSITDENVTLLEALTSTDYSGFKPIELFLGIFDGNNYSIKNVYVNRNENVGGLLKNFGGEKFENLKISGKIYGNGYVGGIMGSISGASTVENCVFSGNIQNCSQEWVYQGTGGISGGTIQNNGTFLINNCVSKGEIVAITNLGGIIGYNVAGICKINKCFNESYIVGKSSVGGIMGIGRQSSIKNSINKGTVQGNREIGGIVGYKADLIMNCYNNGIIKGQDVVGGLVGSYYFTTSSILNSYNIGNIEVVNQNNGAIIGSVYPISTSANLDNVFWSENSANKSIGSGESYTTGQAISITESQINSTEEDGLLKKLNDYVEAYNNQSEENKTDTDGEDLVYWIMDTENGYPTLDL